MSTINEAGKNDGKGISNFFPFPHNVFEDEKFLEYPASFKVVLFYFFKLHNRLAKPENDGWFFHTGERIADEAGVHVRTFWSAKERLEADNYIQVKRGKYNSSKNTRHACWYKVNGFVNGKASSAGQQSIQSIITQKALEKAFKGRGEEIFDWAVNNGLMEKLSETEGKVIATKEKIMVAAGKAYADIYDALVRFLHGV